MPTYEYACESCGARYEKREGFDAKARQKCQQCGKMTAQRMLFAPPIVFKGSGFYKTDSRGSDSAEAGSTDAPPAPDPAAAAHGHSHGPGGHTHGPGGHSHDTPAPAAAPEAKAEKKSTKEATESAAAS